MFQSLDEARNYYKKQIETLRKTSYEVGVPKCDKLLAEMENLRIKGTVYADDDNYSEETWGREVGSTYTIATSEDIKDLIKEVKKIKDWMVQQNNHQGVSDELPDIGSEEFERVASSVSSKGSIQSDLTDLGSDEFAMSNDGGSRASNLQSELTDIGDGSDIFSGLGEEVGVKKVVTADLPDVPEEEITPETECPDGTEQGDVHNELPPMENDTEGGAVPNDGDVQTTEYSRRLVGIPKGLEYYPISIFNVAVGVVGYDHIYITTTAPNIVNQIKENAITYDGVNDVMCDVGTVSFNSEISGVVTNTVGQALERYWDECIDTGDVDKFDKLVEALKSCIAPYRSEDTKFTRTAIKIYEEVIKHIEDTKRRALEQYNLDRNSKPELPPLRTKVDVGASWYNGTADLTFFATYFDFVQEGNSWFMVGMDGNKYVLVGDLLMWEEHVNFDRVSEGCASKGMVFLPDGTLVNGYVNNIVNDNFYAQNDWVPGNIPEGFVSKLDKNMRTALYQMLAAGAPAGMVGWDRASSLTLPEYLHDTNMLCRCFLNNNENGRPYMYFENVLCGDASRDSLDTSYFFSPGNVGEPYTFWYKDRILFGGKTKRCMDADKAAQDLAKRQAMIEKASSAQQGLSNSMKGAADGAKDLFSRFIYRGGEQASSGVAGKKSGFLGSFRKSKQNNDNL